MRSVTDPMTQLVALPKSAAPCPPAKLLAPMGRREKPMAVTTVAATTWGMSRVQYLGNNPRQPSTRPPTMTAPTSVPIPWVVAIAMAKERKVKLIPITIGRRDPIRHTGWSWTRVPIPAMTIQFWISAALSSAFTPATLAKMMIGVILATNIARTCCSPKGTAWSTGTRPLSS